MNAQIISVAFRSIWLESLFLIHSYLYVSWEVTGYLPESLLETEVSIALPEDNIKEPPLKPAWTLNVERLMKI